MYINLNILEIQPFYNYSGYKCARILDVPMVQGAGYEPGQAGHDLLSGRYDTQWRTSGSPTHQYSTSGNDNII